MRRIESFDVIRQFLFRDYGQEDAVLPLDGALQPNDRLEDCQVLSGAAILEPDDIVVGVDDALYVTSGSTILRCDPRDPSQRQIVAELQNDVTALAIDAEGYLLAGVRGVGLMRLGNDGSEFTLLAEVGGVELNCITAIAVATSGLIYLTDGSTKHPCSDWVWDLMEHGATGGLVRFDERAGTATLLAGGLRYPGGICVSRSGSSVLFSEAWAHSISEAPADAPGQHRKVWSNIPAYPGRIRPAEDGGYWVAMFARRTHLVEFVLGQDDYRREMMRLVPPEFWIRPALRTLDSGLEPLQQGQVRKLGIIKPWAPPRSYGLVVRLNRQGEPIESLHSRSGSNRHGIVSVIHSEDALLLAAKGADSILRTEVSSK